MKVGAGWEDASKGGSNCYYNIKENYNLHQAKPGGNFQVWRGGVFTGETMSVADAEKRMNEHPNPPKLESPPSVAVAVNPSSSSGSAKRLDGARDQLLEIKKRAEESPSNPELVKKYQEMLDLFKRANDPKCPDGPSMGDTGPGRTRNDLVTDINNMYTQASNLL